MNTEALVIIRVLDAPRERVWQAWTEPERMSRWWGPKGFTAPHCTNDLRVGGTYLYCMRSAEGQDYWSTGTYREIVAPERLVCTDSFADEQGNVVPASHYGMTGDFPLELLVTVTLEDVDGKTRMTLRHEGLPASEREPCSEGWHQSFDKLAESLITQEKIRGQKITPFLWFDTQAEEAANFYVSVFKDAGIDAINRYGEAGPGPAGSVMVVSFRIEGQSFIALNGGPAFTFSPAISFVVNCETQAEVDALWEKLAEGGQTQQCGWLQDKYGVSWQIVPTVLGELLGDPDPVRANRVMQAMLQMTRLVIEDLRRAYDQE